MHHFDQKLPIDHEAGIPDQFGKLLHLEEKPFGVDRCHTLATVVVEGDQPAAVEERRGRGRSRGGFVAAGLADGGKDFRRDPLLEALGGGLRLFKTAEYIPDSLMTIIS